jgi:nucleotide-binding universal stress UspA family protein
MAGQVFHSILFPLDFSQASEATAPHVRGLAEQTGASVILLHVIPWLAGWYSATELGPPVAGDSDLRKLEEQGTVALELFREKYLPEIRCHCEVISGAVAEMITDKAVNRGVDLIMMPTHGLGRSRPFLIGSTTAKVLHDASCAVWTSPHLTKMKAFYGYKKIVCTVDREDIPRGYLEEATRLASCFDSKLMFVTAVPNYMREYGNEHRRSRFASEFPGPRVHQLVDSLNCSVISETGSVGDVVKRVAETHDADLVLTNRGHLQHPFGKFRTHAYEIVLESPCPVLSLCIFSSPQSHASVKTQTTLETAVT